MSERRRVGGDVKAASDTRTPCARTEQISVARVDALPGVELWSFLGTNRCMEAITDGVWLSTAGLRNRPRAWARNRYRGHRLECVGDEIALLDPNEAVRREASSGDLDLVSIVVDDKYLARLFPDGRSPFERACVRDPDLDAILWRTVGAIADADADSLEREELTNRLLVLAQRRYGARAPSLRQADRGAVRRARELVETCYRRRLTLDEIADAASISKYHLARRFRDEVGLSLHRYVTLLRVREALRRLRRDEAPGEVALACGFADQAHMTRVVRKTVGFTPARYRRARRPDRR